MHLTKTAISHHMKKILNLAFVALLVSTTSQRAIAADTAAPQTVVAIAASSATKARSPFAESAVITAMTGQMKLYSAPMAINP